MTTSTNAPARTADRASGDSGPDAVGMYLAEIGRTPLLTASEEVELASRIEAGLYAQHLLDTGRKPSKRSSKKATRNDLALIAEQGRAAQEQMLQANLRLVVSIARKYRWSGVPLLDLVQEGNLGLVRAVQKFDYVQGNKFSTYATWWIRQAIGRGVHEHDRVVRIPANRATEHHRLRRMLKAMTDETGREPSLSELAEACGLTEQRAKDYLYESQSETSLDLEIGEDGLRLGDLVADPLAEEALGAVEDGLDQAIRRAVVRAALERLPGKQAQIMEMRMGLVGEPMKAAEVAAVLGVSAECVRSNERKALAALREETRLLPLASGQN